MRERFEESGRTLITMKLRRILSRVIKWQRRSVALLMLVLQVGVALAPLAERSSRQTITHAEQRGTRHARMHNESACAICAVRSMQATVAAIDDVPPPRDVPRRLAVAIIDVPASRDPPAANTSRAPPRLS